MMTIAPIAAQQIQGPGVPVRVLGPSEGGMFEGSPFEGPRPVTGPAFGETLADAVGRVDQAQKTADFQVESFLAGETENVHEVMIAMNQAELHFKLMTEVRNKLLDGYQEIMRMQV